MHSPDLRAAGEEAFLLGDLLRSVDLLRRLRPACLSPIAVPFPPALLAALSPLSAVAPTLALSEERGAFLGSDLRSDAGLSTLTLSFALAGEEACGAADRGADPALALSLSPVGHKTSEC